MSNKTFRPFKAQPVPRDIVERLITMLETSCVATAGAVEIADRIARGETLTEDDRAAMSKAIPAFRINHASVLTELELIRRRLGIAAATRH